MRRIHPALLVTLIVSIVLVAGGVSLIGVSAQPPVSFGFVGGAPLSGSLFSPGGIVVLTRPGVIGIVATVVGLVGVSATTGFAIGRRHHPNAAEGAFDG